jgi:hypothetical protein
MFENAKLIHYRALSDAINEAITIHRPLGENGIPMPWTKEFKKVGMPLYYIDDVVSFL